MRVGGGWWAGVRRRWRPLAAAAALLLTAALLLQLLLRAQRAGDALSRRVAVVRRRLLAEPVRNEFGWGAPLHAPASCGGQVALLVLVASAAGNWGRRQAVRDTWGSQAHLQTLEARVVFLLGVDPNASQDMVDSEAAEYGDILQERFSDTYKNLTLKTVAGLRWTSSHCPSVAHVLKTDDDVFWNLPLLRSHLSNLQMERGITGCVKQFSAPEPVNLQGRTAPPGHPLFAAGAGYVLSGDLSGDLYEAARRVRLHPIEDVFITGYCAKMAWVWPPKHHAGFSCGEEVQDDCDLVHVFNAHHVTPDRQHLIWEKFTSEPNPCMDF